MRTSKITFDIFKLQSDGSELPVGEAESYNLALIDLEILASMVPAKYVIRDRETGQKHVLNLQYLDGRSSPARLTG